MKRSWKSGSFRAAASSFWLGVLLLSLASGCGVGGRQMGASKFAQMADSQNNLKQLGLVCKIYANESRGEHFPPLMEAPGHLMFAAAAIPDNRDGNGKPLYPDIMNDTTILVNPGAVDADVWLAKAVGDPVSVVDDQHYVYLGYVVRDDADMDAYTQAYLNAIAQGAIPNTDMEHDGRTLRRLQEGVERHYIEDLNDSTASARVQSAIPLLMERPGVWEYGEINVLYLDGHVATVAAGEFPNTDAFWANVARINSKK